MGNKKIIRIECPKCNIVIEFSAYLKNNKLFYYKCLECGSNVVLYDNKVDIISKKALDIILKRHKLTIKEPVKGSTINRNNHVNRDPISMDDMLNLKIDLAMIGDSADFFGL